MMPKLPTLELTIMQSLAEPLFGGSVTALVSHLKAGLSRITAHGTRSHP